MIQRRTKKTRASRGREENEEKAKLKKMSERKTKGTGKMNEEKNVS